MIRRVVLDKEKHDDVAKSYGLKTAALTRLLFTMRKDKNYMTSLIEHQEDDLQKRKLVREAVLKHSKDEQIFVPAKQIQSQVLEDHEEKVGLRFVRDVLKKDFNMSYAKAKDQAVNINSNRNVLLRQAWARRFLQPDFNKKIFLNIDESWIGQTDFRRMTWRAKGKSSSLPKKALNPRISLTMAIDTQGAVFYSVSQANNNSDTMGVFLKELTDMLDRTRRGWRKNTVVLLDNAPYHTSKETMAVLQRLRVPTMFFAPYSFDVAPCELYFALFKSKDINPEGVPTGKK